MSKKLRMLSLCAGIGGADLAAEATGQIEVVGQVEIDPFCQAVLAKHWPNIARMSDIKEVAGHEFGAIDIVVGGIPCQPHSLAGQRKSSNDERNLWPEFYRIACQAQPKWIVVENVLGLLSSEGGQFFGGILRDLAEAGYDAEWHVLSAAEVGAPHKRERVFLVAYLSGIGSGTWRTKPEKQFRKTNIDGNGSSDVAYSLGARCTNTRDISYPQISRREESRREQSTGWTRRSSESLAHSNSQRCEECDSSTWGSESRLAARGNDPLVEDSTSGRERVNQISGGTQGTQHLDLQSGTRNIESGICRNAYGVPTWLYQHIWPARPNEPQKTGEAPRTITQKIPFRNQRLKALGNAIVPQQIKPIFDAIVAVEREMESVA